MTPRQLAALLVHGPLARERAPELVDEAFAAHVRDLLARAGMALRLSGDHWNAVADADLELPDVGYHAHGRLQGGQALMLLLFVWLCDDDDSMIEGRLRAAAAAIYRERYVRGPLLGFLTGRGYLVADGDTLRPGPELASVDRERVRELLAGVSAPEPPHA